MTGSSLCLTIWNCLASVSPMRHKPRLKFLPTVALVLFLAPFAQAQQAQTGPPTQLRKIKANVYVIENTVTNLENIRKYGGNVLVYLTPDGVSLVDCKFEPMHDDIIAKVKSLTDMPIKYVILTHNHADHAGGAAKMSASGAAVIISTDDLENLARAPNQTWLPDLAYSGRAQVRLGGREVELYEVRGHTRGDTLVYFPAERVVESGDLFATVEELPYIVDYSSGGNWTDLSGEIDDLLKLDFDLVIPGHGPPVIRQDVVKVRDRVVAIRERFRALNREKKSPEEIRQTLLNEFHWGNEPAPTMSIPGMMQELR
jgi:glyoxylase-like metal-dependent hydrolase (beta-lactamase superfamily II)